MVNERKKIMSQECIGILFLITLTAFAGYMGCNKRFFKDAKQDEKVKTESKVYNSDNYPNSRFTYNNTDDYNYVYQKKGDAATAPDDVMYNYSGYKNYNGDYGYDYGYDYNYYYNDKNAPGVQYSSSDIVYQYEDYDPWKNISASHSKFGDVTDYIEITYNDLDVNIPGEYSIVYKACNYPGSIYCRTVTRRVTVKQKEDPNRYNTKAPVWSNNSSKSCVEGSRSCETYNITKPTAKDPYSKRELEVSLINGYVDIYTPGNYVLVYYAVTENNISGTITKNVTIEKSYSNNNNNNNSNNNNNDNYYKQSKYISNHDSSYYDDGTYRGYLNPAYSNNQISKYINDFKWTNKVYYTYRCDNQYEYGLNGWSYISTDTSDDHPIYDYNVGGFKGTLYKDTFYCKNGSECDYERDKQLGTCSNVGEYKQIYVTWIGVYSGTVYSNREQTYSGTVYRYR